MNEFTHVEVWKFLVASVLCVIAGNTCDKRYWLVGFALTCAATLLVVL